MGGYHRPHPEAESFFMADAQRPVPGIRVADDPMPASRVLRDLWSLAWPVVLAMSSHLVMGLVDRYMVSRISTDAFTAHGNGSNLAMVPIAFVTGVFFIVNTFVSQRLGARMLQQVGRYAWTALWIAAACWLVVAPLGLLVPGIFERAGHSPELIVAESGYARIILMGSIFHFAAAGLSHFFCGLHRSRLIFTATIIANCVNVVVNLGLIFGYFGLPALGVTGAAWGTVVAKFVEFAIPMAVFLSPAMRRMLSEPRAWMPRLETAREIIRYGWPFGVRYCNELAIWVVFIVALIGRRFGDDAMNASWNTFGYLHIAAMPMVGLTVAVNAVVGRRLGSGDSRNASFAGWVGIGAAAVYMMLWSAVYIAVPEPLLALFIDQGTPAEQRANILAIGSSLMLWGAIFQILSGIELTLTGALRGAGDTVIPGLVVIISSWVIKIGGGLLMLQIAPGLGPSGPWVALCVHGVVVSTILAIRWQLGAWRHRDLVGRAEPVSEVRAAEAEPVLPAITVRPSVMAGS